MLGGRPWELNTGTVKNLPFMNSLFSPFPLFPPFEVAAESVKEVDFMSRLKAKNEGGTEAALGAG